MKAGFAGATISPPQAAGRALDSLEAIFRRQRLSQVADCVAAGLLPSSSRFAHAVPIEFDMIDGAIVKHEGDTFTAHAEINNKLAAIVERITDQPFELWFNEAGEAFLSFPDEQDATTFRLALV